MTRIDSLTEGQGRMLAEVRDEWIGYGLSTQRADRGAAEAGVRAAYAAVGLDAPVCVWLDSPLGGAIAAAQVWGQVGGQVWDQVWDQVRYRVWDQVGDQVWARVWDQVGDQVWARVGARVGDQVWARVGVQVGDQVRAQVRDQVGAQVRAALDPWMCGWSAWVSAMRRLGVSGIDSATGMVEVSAQSPWWWPLRGVAILTDRPTSLHRDAQGRLHNPNGPAIAYADGFAIHAWHGTRVPADLITPGWDLTTALRHDNTEIRRCAVEHIAGRDGWSGIIAAAGWAQVGDSEPDPGNPGQTLTLYHVPSERDGGLYEQPVRLLHCTNATVERDGTRHEYGLTVPASIPTPIAAAAWTFGVNPSQYRALERAC